jgi:hypothetical protein
MKNPLRRLRAALAGPERRTRPAAEITLASRRAEREARIDAAEGEGRR